MKSSPLFASLFQIRCAVESLSVFGVFLVLILVLVLVVLILVLIVLILILVFVLILVVLIFVLIVHGIILSFPVFHSALSLFPNMIFLFIKHARNGVEHPCRFRFCKI